jgi:hypothetical protein
VTARATVKTRTETACGMTKAPISTRKRSRVINFRVGQRIRITHQDNPCRGLAGVVTKLGLNDAWAYEATRYTVRDVEAIASHVAKSRLYGLSEDQAFTLMLLAESEGLHPIQAVRRFHIIEGRPSMRADAMQAEFQRHGGRLRWIESTAEKCSAEFSHPVHQPEPLLVTVTMKELVESEVAMQWPKLREGEQFDPRRGKIMKDAYKKFPRQMLRARVISEGVRAVDPGVVVGIYTPEEVSDFEEPRPSRQAIAPPPVRPDPQPESRHEAVDSEPPTQPARGECSSWIQARVDETEAEWAILCASAKKPHEKLGLNPWRVINGVITDWVAKELIEPQSVLTDGKRDKSKVMEMIHNEWYMDDHGGELREDVLAYLRCKLETAAKAAGINLDAEPVESAVP